VCPPTLPLAGTGCSGFNTEGLMCAFVGQLCPREDAWCQGGIWHVDACESFGGASGAGAGGAPTFGGAPPTEAGAAQGGAP
ncbi:MAG TPA: hypothetical protein VGM29_06705, partial [Polyangiaceae bacterium]